MGMTGNASGLPICLIFMLFGTVVCSTAPRDLTYVRRGVWNKCDDHAHFAPKYSCALQNDGVTEFTCAQPFTRQKVLPKTSSSHLATSRSIFDRRGPLWCSGIIIGRVYYCVAIRLTGTYKKIYLQG